MFYRWEQSTLMTEAPADVAFAVLESSTRDIVAGIWRGQGRGRDMPSGAVGGSVEDQTACLLVHLSNVPADRVVALEQLFKSGVQPCRWDANGKPRSTVAWLPGQSAPIIQKLPLCCI